MSFRFALIGCGSIGSRHAEQIKAVGQLVAVCDTNASRASEFASRYEAPSYYSIEDLLHGEIVDVAVVCTPNGLHAGHCIKALQAGNHVLCEKPLAITVADGNK